MSENLHLTLERLRVKLLAFPAAEMSVFDRAKKKYMGMFNPEKVEFVNDRPDVLLFLTGGSERIAIESAQEYRFYLILASKEANSWASATEVKAWMNQHNISSLLVNADSPGAANVIDDFYQALNGIRHLHGQRLGVIGSTADWLVASTVSPFILQNRMGIEQVDIAWSDIVFNEVKQVAPDFTSLFEVADNKGELLESGKIYEGLASLVPFYKLNALSVECFPLVTQTNHTACLALAKLNFDNIPSACEADNCSAVGLMFANEVCGAIPWMANTIFVEENKALFAHCTAPVNLLSSFKLDTHFETGKGYALTGELRANEVTIFRFDNTLNRIFITLARVVNRPKFRFACRTQVEVEITESACRYFTNNPFGNHHLVIPGNKVKILRLAALLLRMEIVD